MFENNKAFKSLFLIPSMQLKLDYPKLLTDTISLISELVTEVKIRVDDNGLGITAVDPANVALTNFQLPKKAFSQFEVEEEVLGISLDNLKSVLKRAGKNSSLVLKKNDNNLTVEIHDKIKREFNLSLINIEQEEKEMPDLEFSCEVKMPSEDFTHAINDCSVVADSCSFAIEDGKFIISAKGLNSMRSEFSSDEAFIDGEDGKSKYSLEYLEKIIKACKLTDSVSINFDDDYPLKLEFENDRMDLAFVLAPRVDTEE